MTKEMALYTVVEIAEATGIDLRGPAGHPYHCGERMHVKAGLIGPDYAQCEACGLTIGNAASPHISRWERSAEIDSQEIDGRTWIVLLEQQ